MESTEEDFFYVRVAIMWDYFRDYLIVPDIDEGAIVFNVIDGEREVGVLAKEDGGRWEWRNADLAFCEDEKSLGAAIDEHYQQLIQPEFIPLRLKRGYHGL